MTQFLIKTFIKNAEDIKNPRVREHYGLLGSIVGISCNLLLFLSKLTIGVIFNSISITADAINNLSDAGSSIITWIGFRLSSKPADEDHPFGHARVEYITGLVISFLILMLGIELIKSSFDKILHPEPLTFSSIIIVVLILSIAAKLWLSFFNRKLGNIIGSTTLKATATDSMNDVIATSVVLISILISHFTGFQVDGYMGMIVALFIIYSGINLIKETISPLLGEAPTAELVLSIEEKISSYEGVLGFHDLVVHNYGPDRCFASVHVEVDANEDILKSHDLIDNIE
ncbi:MAG: cation diffusion facilitator family transporter, partial [Cellulosilyticaceae bacterium]